MPQKILVADDEVDIRNLVKIILEKNNYQVTVAANGVEALEKAENELPDLILLDVVMPAKTGWEVCKILKSNDKTKHIPIIIFTALSVMIGDKASRNYAEEAGADGYLPKPFNTEELLAQIKKHLNKGAVTA
jgi:two-component system alkaline phosphatase synthesis response regulator PhoP